MRRTRPSKAFESDAELEFEFFLTKELGLGTVLNLRNRMTQDEFVRWTVYYGRKNQRQQLARRR